MLKKMMSKVIKDMHASGRESMNMILGECLIAASESIMEVLLLHNGYSHVFHTVLLPWVAKMNVSM